MYATFEMLKPLLASAAGNVRQQLDQLEEEMDRIDFDAAYQSLISIKKALA